MRFEFFVVTWIFFIFPALLSADTVVLKNGNEVTGIVTEENEMEVALQFDKESTIIFSRSDVVHVIYASEEERNLLRAQWGKASELPKEVPRGAPTEISEAPPEIPQEPAPPAFIPQIRTLPTLTPTRENQVLLSEGAWKARKTRHFVVYYQELVQGRAVSDRAEYNLEKILDDLRIPKRHYLGEKFTVFVIKEETQWRSFLKKIGVQPELTGGFTRGAKTREIYLYSLSIPYLQLAFPHELTHILLEELAEGKKIPLWFNEGFANYEGGIIGIDEEILMEAVLEGNHIPISELVTSPIYPVAIDQKKLFYTESEKLVEYLINQYGRRRFGDFTERLLNAGDFEKALRSAYGGKIGSVEDLEALWLQYLLE